MLHLDLNGDGPLNLRLMQALKRAVLDGRLPVDTRVPATRALARTLGVSRNTVVDAYEQLVAEGFFSGRVGAGTYVALRAPPPTAVAAGAGRDPRLSAYGRRALGAAPHRPSALRRRPLRWNLEYGAPLVAPALLSSWRRALTAAADRSAPDYPDAQGLGALRAAIARHVARRRGIVADPDDVIVVAGTQQALELSARVLVDPGQSVVIEEPCYAGTRHVLQALGARTLALPVDDEGLCTPQLPRAGARLACVTPSHQFPVGAVLALDRRIALLEWAQRHDAWVLEDDYDGEFRHDGRPLAALKALDGGGRVLYVGSFSKLVFPALRLGYLIVPRALREAFIAAKWLVDRGAPPVTQQALASLMDSGRFERLVLRTGQVLRQRRAALLAGLARHCGEAVTVAGACAGMHVTAWLRDHRAQQLPALVAAAEQLQLGLYPITPYYARPPRRAGLLLGYANLSPHDLDEATRRLARVLGISRSTASGLRHNRQP